MEKVFVSQYQMELIKDALWRTYKESRNHDYEELYNDFFDLQEGKDESFEMVRISGKEDS